MPPGKPPETPSARYTRFNKTNTDGSGRFEHPDLPEARATRGQSATEYALFAVFGILIVLAGVAIYTVYSPRYREVPNKVAAGLQKDRVNILFIGIGGSDHPSQDQLADSVMLLSLKPSTRQAAVMSIPRDLWVPVGRYGHHRLNYAHAAGIQSGYPGDGPGLMTDTVSKIFEQPIHAFVRIDFRAFSKIIDDLGGIDVHCQRSFYDYLFKDGFVAGPHHLDGKRALAFARYRYVIGPEGDNFARELRQQQVLNALREKVQATSPQQAMRLIAAVSTLSDATTTNLTTAQMAQLYSTFRGTRPSDIRHVSLKPVSEIFQVTRLADPGQAVRPRSGNYDEFRALQKNVFEGAGQFSTEDQIHVASTSAR